MKPTIDPPAPFAVQLERLSKSNPEARAHLARIHEMLDPRVIEHPRVQVVVHRQVAEVLGQIALKGMYFRDPKDDHELLQIQNEVTSGG